MKASGIYGIWNTENGKVYVGSTCGNVGFNRRWQLHKRQLTANVHINTHLQYAWNKYGADAFEFRIIEECTDEVLVSREQAWMDHYGSMNPERGYNIRGAGSHGEVSEETREKLSLALRGRKHSREHVKKVALANTGRKCTEETKAKLRAFTGERSSWFGKHHSEETKKKIRETHSGKPKTEEHRKKLRESLLGDKSPWYGRRHSEESKRKIREGNLGRKPSDETRRKMGEWQKGEKSPWYGKNHSDATKEKMKLAAKLIWEKRKAEKRGAV